MKSTESAAVAVQSSATQDTPAVARRGGSIKRALVGTVFADLVVLAIGVATGPVAARLLQPEGRGAVAAVTFWPILLASAGLFSLNEATTYRIGARPERYEITTASAFRLSLLFSLLTISLGLLLIPRLLGPDRASLVGIALLYLVFFVPTNATALTLASTDHGQLRFARYNLQRVAVPAIYLAGLLILWATDRVTVGAVVAASCLGTITLAVYRIGSQIRTVFARATWEETSALLKLALSFHPASLLMFLATQADQFMVLTLWNNETLGKYVVALTISSSSLSVVCGGFQRVLFPHIANRTAEANPERLMARGIRMASLAMVLSSTVLALILGWLLPLLFGEPFRSSVGPARVLLFAYILVALRNLMIQLLRGMGEGKAGAIASALAASLFVPTAYLLGRSMGLYGVAVALGLANILAVAYLGRYIARKWNLRFADLCGLNSATLRELWTYVTALRARTGLA